MTRTIIQTRTRIHKENDAESSDMTAPQHRNRSMNNPLMGKNGCSIDRKDFSCMLQPEEGSKNAGNTQKQPVRDWMPGQAAWMNLI